MRETLFQFNNIVDYKNGEAAVEVRGKLPVFKEPEANEEMKIVKEKIEEAGKMLSVILEKYTRVKEDKNDRDEKLDHAIEQGKLFGSIAELMKDIMGDDLSEKDQKDFDRMIMLSKLAKLAEELKYR